MKIDKFYVRIVLDGDGYGVNLTHTGKPMVEFYDTRHGDGRGQFVQRYYIETLLAREGGLMLVGGVPEWSLSGEDMRKVREYLTEEVKNDY
jgi:hypothetical protein